MNTLFRLSWGLHPFWFAATLLLAGGVAGWEWHLEGEPGAWSLLTLLLVPAGPLATLVAIALLRGDQVLRRAFWKIAFSCPRCHYREAPIFCCRNGHDQTNLRPSVFGALWANCGVCRCWLATSDRFGRLRLARRCGRCDFDLSGEANSLGRVPEFKLGVIGPKRSGKTTFVVAALWQLKTQFAPLYDLEVSFPVPAQKAAYDQQVKELSSGRTLLKTQHEEFPSQMVVRLQDKSGWGCLLSVVDAAGEDFEDNEALVNHPLEDYDGLIVLVDPFAEPTVQEGVLGPLPPDAVLQADPSDVSPSTVLTVVLKALEHRRAVTPGKRIGLMVAVVATKIDVSPVAERCPRLSRRQRHFPSIAAAALYAERHDEAIEDLMRDMGLSNMVNQLHLCFDEVGFFAASPLGRPAIPPTGAPFAPRGVLEPVIWLGYHLRALEETSLPDFCVINIYTFFKSGLSGRSGLENASVAWGCLGLLAVLLVLLAFLFPMPLGPFFDGVILVLIVGFIAWGRELTYPVDVE